MGWVAGSLSGSEIPEATRVTHEPGKTMSLLRAGSLGETAAWARCKQQWNQRGERRGSESQSHPGKAGELVPASSPLGIGHSQVLVYLVRVSLKHHPEGKGHGLARLCKVGQAHGVGPGSGSPPALGALDR